MKEQAQALVDRFVQARDAIRAAFRMESDYMYPVCASVFLAADRPVEPEELDRCKKLVKGSVGIFSNFRGNIKLPLICMLAAGDDPEDRWEKTQRAYALLKERFFGSEYLALAALLLSDAVREEDLPALAARGRELYQRMKKEHPFLTGQEDSVFALLLAQSPRTDEELIEDMEACYALLDERFPKGDGLQSASHVLSLCPGTPEEKAGRVIALFDAIEAAGGKYGKDRQLPLLAALSLKEAREEELVQNLLEVDERLSVQKGYKGIFGLDRRTRTMHAAMLLCLPEAGESATAQAAAGQSALSLAAAQQATLAMIIAQQALMCALVASSAAASAANSAH